MTSRSKLAVASSVSMEQRFDLPDALSYAIEHQFEGFQAYMNTQVVHDTHLREHVRTACEQANLTLIVHAPATLRKSALVNYPINAAAKNLYPSDRAPLVVHHYDETILLEESLECLQELHDERIITCLENFFLLGADTSKHCFHTYLELLITAKRSGFTIMPVFDIPRLYHERVNLHHQALSLIDQAFQTFSLMQTPIILHLIDVHTYSQERQSWCPIGQGIIPYTEIFQLLHRYRIAVPLIILEYEDKINPVQSKPFLEEQLVKQMH